MNKIIVMFLAVLMLTACASTSSNNNSRVATLPLEDCIKVEVLSAPAPAPTTVQINQPIMFDWDEAVIRDDQVEILDKVAGLMKQYPDTLLAIDGYASKEGPVPYNLELSIARAESVKGALVDRGISADRIQNVVGKGATTIFGDILSNNRKVVILSVE